jgi:tryptophan halogenase
MHYCLTQRTDHAFWRDNADAASIPDTLRDKLSMWRGRPPHRMDFVADYEMYPTSSWQYVLYGMEFKTGQYGNSRTLHRYAEAQKEFQMIDQLSHRAMADLPSHRSLVEHYLRQGERKSA